MMKGHMTIPVFLPHMGCPQACTFCNQNTISGTHGVPFVTDKGLRTEIETWLGTVKGRKQIEIGFFGGSFTGLPLTLQDLCLGVAKTYLEAGYIEGIRLSTRPDYMNLEIAKRLKTFGVTTVELGVQSFSEAVLVQTNRGHDQAAIYKAIACLEAVNIQVGIQLMLGLPADTQEAWEDTVSRTIAINPSCVRLYPALVFSQTVLEQSYKAGDYKPLSLDEAVTRAAYAYKRFNEVGITVIRMGLQASEATSDDTQCIAGPKHDSFRELVESALYREMIERDLVTGFTDKPIGVMVNPKHVSFFCGHKQSNLVLLKEKGFINLKIIKNDTIKPYTYVWVFK